MSSPTSGEEGESNCNYEMPSITVEDKTNETMTGETTAATTTTTHFFTSWNNTTE
jgi:hypothetical protein